MAKYYKGEIVEVSSACEEEKYVFNFLVSNKDDDRYFMNEDDRTEYIARDYYKYLYGYFSEWVYSKNQKAKAKLDDLLESYYKNAHKLTRESIIYEKIYDKDNNAYAKEIISGKIFPISNDYSKYNISIYKDHPKYQKVFFDKERNRIYYISRPPKIRSFTNDEITLLTNTYNELNRATKEGYKVEFTVGDGITVCLRLRIPVCFRVEVTPEIKINSNQRIEYTVFNEVIATELEVSEYLNEFNGFFRKGKRNNFIKDMSTKSSSNYLGNNLIYSSYKTVKQKEKEELLTKEMQELEYMLTKLKAVSEVDYNKINNEYQEILEQDEDDLTINPLVMSSIITLQNKARLAYLCNGGSSKQINEYLEKQVELYLNNCKNNPEAKTKITISDIDSITEKVLKSKSNYSYREQNDILRHLALLYFFEVYENKDTITSSDLSNSYINSNIKRIITIISVLLDEGIIKDIDSDMFIVDNLDKLIDLIKGIEIKISKDELIKRIQL